MGEIKDIPKHWKKTTLGKILSISSGNGLTKSNRNDEGEFLYMAETELPENIQNIYLKKKNWECTQPVLFHCLQSF